MLFERLCMPDTQHVLRATCAGAHGGHCRSTLCSPTQRITQAAAGDDAHTQAHTSANALRMPLKCEFSMATRMQPLGCSTADTRAALLSCRVPSDKDPALWVHGEWQQTGEDKSTAGYCMAPTVAEWPPRRPGEALHARSAHPPPAAEPWKPCQPAREGGAVGRLRL